MSAKSYLFKRIMHALLVTFLVITAVFAAVRSIPGDPARMLLGGDAPPEAIEEVRQDLGLDEPIYVQYYEWLSDIVRGDLGESVFSPQSVNEVILQAADPTFSIAMLAIIIATVVAIPLGVYSAVNQYKIGDQITTIIAFFGISMPGFWVGILLVFLIATRVDLLPTFGYVGFQEDPGQWFMHILLPSIAAAVLPAASILRMMRSSMLEVLNKDYVRLARAKGLDSRVILYKHALQNALIPVVTLYGILTAGLLGGVVAIEVVFGINGFGQLIIDSIRQQNFPVVQGIVIVVALIFIFMNLFIDILYTFINPQITYGEEK